MLFVVKSEYSEYSDELQDNAYENYDFDNQANDGNYFDGYNNDAFGNGFALFF